MCDDCGKALQHFKINNSILLNTHLIGKNTLARMVVERIYYISVALKNTRRSLTNK